MIVTLRECQFSHVNYTDRIDRRPGFPKRDSETSRENVMIEREEASSRGTHTDRGTVFSCQSVRSLYNSEQISHEYCYA